MIDVKSIAADIKGLTEDSRKVEDGFLFAAFPGVHVDGRDFIPAAIENGASYILTDTSSSYPSHDTVEFIRDENPRKIFAKIAAEFFAPEPETIAAVTGTNGKTSVVHFTNQIWSALGKKSAALGTLQGAMTTPDTVTLHKNLKALSADGVTHAAIEASSHGLDQRRLDGVKIRAAGFTNLSRDHLDYHNTMDEYRAAKMRLFTEVMQQNGTAVINADNDDGKAMLKACKLQNVKTFSYGAAGEELKLLKITPEAKGQKISLEVHGKTYNLTIPLVGDFQIMNALCALGLVLSEEGIDQDKAVRALETLKGAKGRLEYIGGHPSAAIYVDYAHTPDALEHVLNALRPHTDGRLVCVFGCGGDRDTGKRPVMGEIATRLADAVIITDDNPRSEDPALIRAAILKGAPDAQEIAGRREAIRAAIQTLQKGDILVIAGKGHEQGQIFATHTDPFDDVTVAKEETQKITQNI